MRLTIEFRDGPVTAQIEAEEDDNYREALNELSDFVKEYYELIDENSIGNPTEADGTQVTWDSLDQNSDSDSATVGDEPESENDDEQSEAEDVEALPENEDLAPLLERVGISERQLKRLIQLEEDSPRILAGNFLPAKTKQRKMLQGTVVLLAIWKLCYGNFWVPSGDVPEALEKSGIPNDRLKRIYNEDDWNTYFDKKGHGKGTELGIKPLGEDRTVELLEEMAEESGV